MGLTRFLYGSIQLRMVYNGWKRVVLSFNQYHLSMEDFMVVSHKKKTGFASLLAISGVIQHGWRPQGLEWMGFDDFNTLSVCKSKGCLTESSIYMYICMYIYIYTYTNTYTYIYIYVYIMYICFYIFRYACIGVCKDMCIYRPMYCTYITYPPTVRSPALPAPLLQSRSLWRRVDRTSRSRAWSGGLQPPPRWLKRCHKRTIPQENHHKYIGIYIYRWYVYVPFPVGGKKRHNILATLIY